MSQIVLVVGLLVLTAVNVGFVLLGAWAGWPLWVIAVNATAILVAAFVAGRVA